METKKWVGIAVIFVVFTIFIILGFRIGASIPQTTEACTEMACPCDSDGERQCNTCSVRKHVFLSGVVNVYDYCSAKEIITCENGIQTGKRIEVNRETCNYGTSFFEFTVEY